MKLTMFNIVIRKKKKAVVAVVLAYLPFLKKTKLFFSVLPIKNKYIQIDFVSLGLDYNSAKGTILTVDYFEELLQEYTSN